MVNIMTTQKNIEVFSAGCPLCDDALALVENAAASHAVDVRDLREEQVAARARALGIRTVPAVVIDGELLDCCAGRGVSEQTLREALAEEVTEERSSQKGCC